MSDMQDLDPVETREWLESVEDVIDRDGTERAHFLLDQAVGAARARGANLPFGSTTGYVNTIPVDQQPPFPGDLELEWRIRTINRWNAMATVVRRNKVSSEYGGHIASFASSAVLYDIGLNHFWRTRSEKHGGDLVFFQGHARGLGDPVLVVSDGAPGVIRAIDEAFPRSARQRCLAHRMRNLAAKVPTDLWPEFKARATACYQRPEALVYESAQVEGGEAGRGRGEVGHVLGIEIEDDQGVELIVVRGAHGVWFL